MVNTTQTWGESDKRMTGSSKILTVSYGTFSCTLEGFDDPFSTMRTIAEYFRDLAAEDRYFGAEPPTPDPAMLQNLAEREAARRVEARLSDGSIALRQMEADEVAPVAPQDPDTIEATPETATDITDAADAFEADEPENAFSDIGQTAEGGDDAAAESIAEKLKRIRAVVSRSRDAAPFLAEDADNRPEPDPQFEDDDLVVDASALQPAVEDTGPSEAELAQSQLSATIASLTAAVEADDELEDETDDEVGPELDAHLEAENDGDSDDHTDDAEDHDHDDAIHDRAAAALGEFDGDVPEDVVAEDAYENGVEDDGASEVAPIAEAEQTYSGPETVLTLVETVSETDEPDLEPTQADANTEGSSGDDTQPSMQEANEPDVSRLMAEADTQFEDGEGQRRRRVISQLRAAVVAAKADQAAFGGDREADDAVEQIAYREDLSRVVSRKRETTPDAQLQTAEDTVAEMLSENASGEDAEDAKVTPLAPLMLGSEQRIETADDTTMAEDDIHPRRVELDPSAPQQQDMASFADFANSMGATELPDLLEAAAAYTAFVEGQGSFSRPQIMKRVARIQPTVELSREAGLRSFGQLLRQGKIQKLHRGEFTIAETTRFNPGHKIAGE